MSKDKKSKFSAANRSPAQMQISPKRLWSFRIIAAVVIPVLVLMLLEVTLRVTGYGYPAATFVRAKADGRTVYYSNCKFGWRFFPPEISRWLDPFVVPADKTDNTYRIFILGESAAWGDPEPAYCFGRQLSVMLRRQYPSVNFEVYTVAMVAINSHAIVQIAKDCAQLKPDLFVVYMGNNEVVGPYGAGTIFSSLSKSMFLIRINVAMKTTRVGQLMSRLADITIQANARPETWGGLEMFLGKQIRQDDEKMQYVYSHFRRNLEDIIRCAQKAGAKTIVSTVAVNLKDCPPFASLHRLNLGEQVKQFDSIYQHGVELEKAGDFNGAIDSYLAAAEIDDTYAELQFCVGRCRWNLGQFDKARERYAWAMELDTLRFRADPNINRIIREVGENRESQGIYLVDAADEFAGQSPHNCPGFELFLDHVHLDFSGNYLLAKTVFDQVEQVLPDKIKAQKAADATFSSEDVCARQLAFTAYDCLRVTETNLEMISKRQPFINQAYHKEDEDFWRQKFERLKISINPAALAGALEQYEQAIKVNSTDRYLRLNYSELLLEDRKYVSAAEQCRLIIKRTPYDHCVLVALATLEKQLGNIDSALEHAVRATRYMPTDSIANYLVGMLYLEKGLYGKAQEYIAEAIRLNPKFVRGYASLARILGQQGKIEQAEKVYRKGIEAVPDDASLHFNLALLLRKNGQLEEAEKERQKARSLDPNLSSLRRPATVPMK
ncbi:MAG: tetratricopeptide repeat protein [Planctomycetes bacterium]|nr:tetratricopeptide repeat protein [Planctomycetota bacterium]